MSKLKLWKPFSLFMVLLLMLSLVAVVPARPAQANVSSITVNPYDTSIIGLNTGYRITMTAGASLNAGDNITIVFPTDTTVPDLSGTPGNVFVQDTACATVAVSVSVRQVTVTIPAITPLVPGQQFTVTFNKACNILNPTTSGSPTVTVWTTVEPTHITSNSYEITAVKVYTGATKHSENATITGAIAAAITGDTITVPAGTYTENLIVNIPLTLQGASSATVTVKAASPTVSVFTVTANNVNISGFTATGTQMFSNEGYAGIKFGAGVANCNIHDNILSVNQYGILLIELENTTTPGNNTFMNNTASGCVISGIEMQHSYGNTFVNNIANSNKQGFKLDSARNNTFTGNTANSNTTTGFFLARGDGIGSNDNTFTNNIANSNTNHGFRIDGSTGNTLTGNTVTLNVNDGIKLKITGGGNPGASNNTIITGNNLSGNSIGIDIVDSGIDATTLTVSNNNITGNTSYGVSNAGTGMLNAKFNYWNNASGPSHDSPVTYGDKVSANVNFSPWLVTTSSGAPPASEITISTASPLPDGTTGVAYSTPLSATGGSGPYTWAYYSGSVPGLSSFAGSNFSGTPTQVNPFSFALQVKDGTQGTYKDFAMQVYSGAPAITTTSPLPGGTVNVPYGPVQLQATGGNGTYAWSINTGVLPTGLSLGPSDGKISGTPTAAGTFNFNVRVVSGIQQGYKDLSITITAAPSVGQKIIGMDDATPSGYGGVGYQMLNRFQAVASDNMTGFRVKCNVNSTISYAVYTDNNTSPGARLAQHATPQSCIAGWNTLAIDPVSLTTGNYYWLSVYVATGGIGYNTSGGTRKYKLNASTFPDPFNNSGFSSDSLSMFMAGWSTVVVTPPTVANTGGADPLHQTSATLNGAIAATGGENPTVIIYWGSTNGGTNPYAWDHSVNLGTKGIVTFSTDISGLNPSTMYYYRCFAANSGGNAWATPSESFTTSVLSAPTVTNSPGASSVTATSARLNGAITDTGGANPTVTIYWGDHDGVTNTYNWDNSANLGTKSAVTFFTDITDLTRGTKYYYRCFGSNSSGPAWAGSSENFTTLSGGGGKLIGMDDATPFGYGAVPYQMLSRFQAAASGNMAEFRVKCNVNSTISYAVYADSSGSPGARLAQQATPQSCVAGWNTLAIAPVSLTTGNYYWLSVYVATGGIGYNTSGGTRKYKLNASTFPDPFNNSGFTEDSISMFYAGWGSGTLPAPPAPPAIVTPKTIVTFEWAASGGATKYRLQVNTMSDFTGTSMFDAEVSTTSQAVTLTVGTPYYWRVKAGNTGGWSSWSATGSVTP